MVWLWASAFACHVFSSAPLTLNEVLDSVQMYSPLIMAAQADVRMAQGEWLASKGGFDTQFKTRAHTSLNGYYDNTRVDASFEQPTSLWGTSFIGGWRLGEGDFAEYDGKSATGDGGEFRLGMQVPLWRNGPIDRRRAQLKKSVLGVRLFQEQERMQHVELQRLAAHRYYQWVAAFERYHVAQKLLDLAVQRDTALQSRVTAGDLAALDQMDNKRSVLTRQQQLVAAERLLQQTAYELSMYYRNDKGLPLIPTESQRVGMQHVENRYAKTRDTWVVEEVVSKRPDYQRLMFLKEQAQVEQSFQKNQVAPSIDLQLTASQDIGPRKSYQKPTDVEAGVVVEIPLQRRLQIGRLDVASEAVRKIEAQQQWLRDQIEVALKDTSSAVEKAHERWLIAQNEAVMADELARLEGKRFALGDSHIIFLNLREQTAAEAEIRQIDAWMDMQRAEADYNAAQGLLQR